MVEEVDRIIVALNELSYNRQQFIETAIREKIERTRMLEITRNRVMVEMVILQSVEESLSSLGQSTKSVLYYHLSNAYNLRRMDIPARFDDFMEALEAIIGSGAKHLEVSIISNIYRKFNDAMGYTPEMGNLLSQRYLRGVESEAEER